MTDVEFALISSEQGWDNAIDAVYEFTYKTRLDKLPKWKVTKHIELRGCILSYKMGYEDPEYLITGDPDTGMCYKMRLEAVTDISKILSKLEK